MTLLGNANEDMASLSAAMDGGASAPARIVHLVSALHEGGIERLLVSMAPYWDRARFSVEVWCLNIGGTPAYLDALRANGLPVQVLGRFERERIEPLVVWRLVVSIIRHRVAILHTHTPYPLAVAMIARLFVGSRVAHIHHQHLPPPKHQRLPMHTLGKIKPPDYFIAVSAAIAASTRALLPKLACPITVILNGTEIPQIQATSDQKSFNQVFTAGRLTAQKNTELLLLAMEKVLRNCPEATLTILGDGELRNSLREKSRLLGIENHVRFLGHVLRPEMHYSRLGVFVLPSLYEGLPLSLLEAMAWGKPCVATAVDGTREVLRNEMNGLLVPSNDPQAMAQAIIRLMNDPALAARLGHEARKTSRNFDIRNTVDQIQVLYSRHV